MIHELIFLGDLVNFHVNFIRKIGRKTFVVLREVPFDYEGHPQI